MPGDMWCLSIKLSFNSTCCIFILAIYCVFFREGDLCMCIWVLTVRNLKPRVEIIPAMTPINMAPNGAMLISAHVPTATPPARVAFWMWTYERNLARLTFRFSLEEHCYSIISFRALFHLKSNIYCDSICCDIIFGNRIKQLNMLHLWWCQRFEWVFHQKQSQTKDWGNLDLSSKPWHDYEL